MNESPRVCPSGTRGRIEPWGGGDGWIRSCGKYHGPFEVWRDDKRILAGTYVDDERDGEWRHFAPDGSLRLLEVWDHGRLVSAVPERNGTGGFGGSR
jgi:hypothetical protein